MARRLTVIRSCQLIMRVYFLFGSGESGRKSDFGTTGHTAAGSRTAVREALRYYTTIDHGRNTTPRPHTMDWCVVAAAYVAFLIRTRATLSTPLHASRRSPLGAVTM
jgi:hypothetical protein